MSAKSATNGVVKLAFGLQRLPIGFVRIKNWTSTEMRLQIKPARARQYAAAKREGNKFPPAVVFVDHDEIYRVGDGFHRIEAAFINGEAHVEVDVHKGGLREAMLWNLSANRDDTRGLPLTHGDKGNAARRMLSEKAFSDWTERQIAKAIGCGKATVHRARQVLSLPPRGATARTDVTAKRVMELRQEGLSTREIAKKLDTNHKTVIDRIHQGDPQRSRPNFSRCPNCNGTGRIPIANGGDQ